MGESEHVAISQSVGRVEVRSDPYTYSLICFLRLVFVFCDWRWTWSYKIARFSIRSEPYSGAVWG
jgi:hypothetical protein